MIDSRGNDARRNAVEPSRRVCELRKKGMGANPLEEYLRELRVIRGSGAAVPETSYYPALANLLNAVGGALKPKVRCIQHPTLTHVADSFARPARGLAAPNGHGVGFPDLGYSHRISCRRAPLQNPH